MNNLIGLSWGSLLFRGIIALLFGILVLVYPGLSLASLIYFFSAFAVVTGVFVALAALNNRKTSPDWAVHLIEGLISLVIGVAVWTWPGITALLLLYVIAFWAIISGVMQLITAIQLRRVINNEFLLIVGALLSIIFGAIVFRFPGAGAIAIAWVIGVYAVLFGLVMIMLAFRVKKVTTSLKS